MRPTKFVALMLATSAQIALGQQVPISDSHTLTLDEAINTARQNNPALQQTKELVRNSEASVRTTYAALLPSANASVGAAYTQAGTQIVQGVQLPAGSDSYNGSYRLNFGYNISAAAAFAPRAARANRNASEANVTSSVESLRANVTTQYIQALEQQATAVLDDSLIVGAQGQLDLANAKMRVGAGTILDVRNGEVALGQAEVAALQAHNQARIEKLKLFELMGVAPDTSVQLTTAFTVAANPPGSLDSLLTLAHRVNPDLAAKKSTEYASEMQVHSAQTQYLPTLSVSTGFGGTSFGTPTNSDNLVAAAAAQNQAIYSNCLVTDSIRVGSGLAARNNCTLNQLSAAQIQTIRNSNDPFAFRRTPFQLSAGISLPLFNNYQREASLEQARVARDNAVYDVKARELALNDAVTTAYLNLLTAEKTAELQETTARQAQEALSFAEESYRVGSQTFLQVTTARGQYQQAAVARVNSIYDYHKAFANLEGAVGRPLR